MSVQRIPVTTMANGSELSVYLHDLRGTLGDGPTVGICGAIHGDEPTGTQVIMNLMRRLVDTPFRGRLLLLPVANPLGFEAVRRHTPFDDQNLNRLFPGNERGWLSEQLASVVSREFLEKIDVLIDLHSGGDSQTVDYVYIVNDEKLSRSFGSRILYRPTEGLSGTHFQGTSATITEARGVPTVTVELGGGVVDQGPYVERGVAGLENMLKTLGTIEGEPWGPRKQVVVHEISSPRPQHGGILEREAPDLGAYVTGGSVLGRVVNPHTFEEIEVVTSPVKHGIMILEHLTNDIVWPGDYGYMVGNLEGAEGDLPEGAPEGIGQ